MYGEYIATGACTIDYYRLVLHNLAIGWGDPGSVDDDEYPEEDDRDEDLPPNYINERDNFLRLRGQQKRRGIVGLLSS